MQMPAEGQNVSMPVVVWLHSGSFVVGGAANIDPSYVMDRDLVLVVPQYRLGFLGTPFCLQLLLWLFRLPVCLVISVTPSFCLSVRFSVYLSVSQFLSRCRISLFFLFLAPFLCFVFCLRITFCSGGIFCMYCKYVFSGRMLLLSAYVTNMANTHVTP